MYCYSVITIVLVCIPIIKKGVNVGRGQLKNYYKVVKNLVCWTNNFVVAAIVKGVSLPRYEPVLAGEVPLAVLDEEVEGEEEGGQGQEEEEAVVEVSVADAVDVAELPRQGDDLRVQGEGHAQGSWNGT